MMKMYEAIFILGGANNAFLFILLGITVRLTNINHDRAKKNTYPVMFVRSSKGEEAVKILLVLRDS